MHVAVVQTDPKFGEVTANVHAAVNLMQSARADFYVLPELFNTGYNFADSDEVARLAEGVTGFTYHVIAEFARCHACYVVYGFAERAEKIYNSAALIGPTGHIGLYRKVHLFDRENTLFEPGNLGFPVFNLPIGNIGIMICFDWLYPESARTLALKGAQLIAHPSNLVMPYCPDAMVTRCLENRVFAATADRVGEESREGVHLQFIGQSEIVSPSGEILARLGGEGEEIRVVEVELSLANIKRLNKHNDLLKGRREDQYR